MPTARTVPRAKSDFSWTGSGWTATSPRAAASIARRYGDPAAADQTDWLNAAPVDNPNLVTGGAPSPVFQTQSNARDLQARNVENKTLIAAADTAQRANNAAAGQEKRALAAIPGQEGVVVNDTTVGGATVPAGASNGPSGLPEGQVVNPHLNPDTADWAAQGGSEASLHQRQVRVGLRPRIDARTVHSPMEAGSKASNEIRAGFTNPDGSPQAWPSTTFGNQGSAIWDQMTQKFNAARAKLQQSLGVTKAGTPVSDNTTSAPFDTPPDDMVT